MVVQHGEEQRQQLVSVISMLKKEFLALRNVIGGEAAQAGASGSASARQR
jgi:hypothetical protein